MLSFKYTEFSYTVPQRRSEKIVIIQIYRVLLILEPRGGVKRLLSFRYTESFLYCAPEEERKNCYHSNIPIPSYTVPKRRSEKIVIIQIYRVLSILCPRGGAKRLLSFKYTEFSLYCAPEEERKDCYSNILSPSYTMRQLYSCKQPR